MRGYLILHVFYFAVVALAVKHELFKDCAQTGFCVRNRHFARKIIEPGSTSPYYIDGTRVKVTPKGITGFVLKDLPNGDKVDFEYQLLLLKGDSIRFKVDENRVQGKIGRVNGRRFDGTASAAFDEDPQSKTLDFYPNVTQKPGKLSFNYGPSDMYSLNLQFRPMRLTISKNDIPVLVFNEKQFFNIEQRRTKEENEKHMISDLETDFDMFEDSFPDSKDDTIPLGPESVAADVTMIGSVVAYGIPEHADSLSLKLTLNTDSPYRLYNVDIFEYETDSRMPMYGSIPLLIGVAPETSVGVFWVNSADTFVDIDKSTQLNAHWMSENGVMDVVFLVADTPIGITQKFGLLTGNIRVPQKFALGYHQCRWNYVSEKDLLDVHSKMDEHMIPYDTIWLDVEYTDKKKYFTWDESQFPNHIEMIKTLDETGRNLVVIVDPHLKTEYEISDYVAKHNLAMKDREGNSYKGHCWPGESIWIDSLDPASQSYWDSLFRNSTDSFIGTLQNVHLWNDMNEPSVFNGPETSAPRDNLHYQGYEHRSVHNIWGKSFHELTYNSLVKRLAESSRQRPFILTRAFFAGSQRTAAMWTGDNMAKWEYLKISIPMILTMNVVNMPFAGADVGGFFGDPSNELLTRWYQAGIWYPFFRAHAHIDSTRREPYLAGEPYTSIMRDAIRLRYAFLPTLYTLFYESSVSGLPIWRPMSFDFPDDYTGYEIDDQFFLGSSGLLIKPVADENASEVSIYIPRDGEVYYDYTNGQFNEEVVVVKKSGVIEKQVQLSDIPMFIKGGSIIARQDRYRRSSKLMATDPYTLVIAMSKQQTAKGSLYLDDGESLAYEKGDFSVVSFLISDLVLTSTTEGAFAQTSSFLQVEKIIIVGFEGVVAGVSVKCFELVSELSVYQKGSYIEIQNPQVRLSESWSMELLTGAEHDEL